MPAPFTRFDADNLIRALTGGTSPKSGQIIVFNEKVGWQFQDVAITEGVTVAYLNAWGGSSNIQQVGVIKSGVWEGSIIDKAYMDPTFTPAPPGPIRWTDLPGYSGTWNLGGTDTATINGYVSVLKDIIIASGQKFRIDGSASGDTYVTESSANVVDIYAGGTNTVRISSSTVTVTGSIGSTGSRVTKGWFTDLEVTNSIVASITGNAATATALQNARTIGGVSFNGTANITVATATGGFTVSGGALTITSQDVIISSTFKLRLDGSSVGDTYISESSANNINFTVGGTSIADMASFFIVRQGIFIVGGSGADQMIWIGATSGLTFRGKAGSTYDLAFQTPGTATPAGSVALGILTGTDYISIPSKLIVGGTATVAGDFGVAATKKIYLDGVALSGDTYLYESSSNVLDMFVGGTNTFRSSATVVTLTAILTLSGGTIGSGSNLSIAWDSTNGGAIQTFSSKKLTINALGNAVELGSTGVTCISQGHFQVVQNLSIGNSLNSISPTAPNRTITMVVGGTTVYLHAKTTND